MRDGLYVRFSAPEGGAISDIAMPFHMELARGDYEQRGYDLDLGGLVYENPRGERITVILSNHPMEYEDRHDPSEDTAVKEAEHFVGHIEMLRGAEDIADEIMERDDDLHEDEREDE